jgi:hypothetical protein
MSIQEVAMSKGHTFELTISTHCITSMAQTISLEGTEEHANKIKIGIQDK